MRQQIGRTIIGLLFVAALAGVPVGASAHSIAGEPPGFDPELLISDAGFLTTTTMTGDEINAFLQSKGSWLANYTIPEFVDVPYFCKTSSGANEIQTATAVRQIHVNGTPLYGMRAADLIAERASVNGLNPQVVLVLLERESSAVTRANPSSQMTRAWPLFYGFDETMASYGYSCTRAEEVARNYGGLGLQIGYGAYGTKNNYNRAATSWSSPVVIDGVTLNCKSRATRAIYYYTPHIHPGNHNFWYLFNLWFAPWQATWVTQNTHPTLTNGQSYQFEIQLRNSGFTTWNQGEVFLGTNSPRDRQTAFTRGAGWTSANRVGLIETSVAPGGTGTFRFTLTVPNGFAPGTYREYFQPVVEGVTWMPDVGIYWDLTVLSPAQSYHAGAATQNASPAPLRPGQSYEFEVKLQNTGIVAWNQGEVFLGTSNLRDRQTAFTRGAGWTSANRVGLVETSVAPGATGTFRFSLSVPQELPAATYREYFQPVAEGVTWLEDQGIYWEITILPEYHSQWVSQNAGPTMLPGQSYQFEVMIRNAGNATWNQGEVFLGTSNLRDRQTAFTRGAGWTSANRVGLVETSVAPGATGTFRFSLSVPQELPAATYREYFQPVAEGVTWMEDQGIYWEVRVLPPNAYQSQWVSQNAYPTLTHGQGYQFEVQIRNTGAVTWTPDVVELATNNPLDRQTLMTRGAGWATPSRVPLADSSVAPGAVGTFRFAYQIPSGVAAQTYREYFRPIAKNITPMEDQGIYWDIRVVSLIDSYHAAWVRQNSHPALRPGDSYQFEVQIQNTGANTWTPSTVFLGASHSRDRQTVFSRGAGWASANRVSLVESSVAPGATGTFRFTLTVPQNLAPGTYREYFQPVAEGVTWMEDQGIYWDIRVVSLVDSYHAAWVSQNAYPTLLAGQSYQFEVQIRNTGVSVWTPSTVRLGTSHPRDRQIIFTRGAGWASTNRVSLVEASVAPNEIGTFRFTLTVPNGLAPGTYREYFQPVAEGVTWMEDQGIYWDVRVE